MSYIHVAGKGLCKVKKIQKIQKKLEVGGPGLIWIKKKMENRQKIKFCVCTIRPCLAVHVAPRDVHARSGACMQHFITYSVIL